MRALVTGATGFVEVIWWMLCSAAERRLPRLPGRPIKRQASPRRAFRSSPDISTMKKPSFRPREDQDVVYHVAGVVAARNEAEFLRPIGTAPSTSLRQLNRPGLDVSSSSRRWPPAALAPGLALDGSEPPRPVTAYGRSKLASEEVVRSSRLQWSIVRPPMVYGPRDREVFKVFRLVRYGIAPLFGDGTQELSAVHARRSRERPGSGFGGSNSQNLRGLPPRGFHQRGVCSRDRPHDGALG